MLVAILGKMGSGKTLAQTFFLYRAFLKGEKVFANYPLTFPHKRITSIEELNDLKRGVFGGDELWSWLDSRSSGSQKNRFTSSILLRSRKRGFDVFFTAQHFIQMDPRIRRVTDVLAIPKLNHPTRATVCRVHFYDIFGERIRPPLSFHVAPVFRLYNTTTEIKDIKGFEAQKFARKLREKRIIERAKEEGITIDDD